MIDANTVEIGNKYRVLSERETFFGECEDIIEIEGQEVEVTDICGCGCGSISIKSANGTHWVEAVNLEEIND